MFTQIEPRDITTEGVLQTNEFTIKANGKAFKVLIDGLYSDKIRSIIRELWSNAYDSHTAAGIPDRPFDCHLPTVWEPEFRVRDYGVSLSHHDVMHLYTTVFESTKEHTNAQVGKLGLGSKSPFAYTDTFTVTTWKDGKKHVYSAFIGETYVPTIALLGVEDTDEPTGLEVAFPVKDDDVSSFRYAAEFVVRGFDVPPTITGSQLREDTRDVLYSGEGWKLYDDNSGACAKQGCVIYPIDPHMVTGATTEQREFLRASLFIDFPIGDLEIAASREGLGYTDETCANILAQVDRIIAETASKLTEEFKRYDTYWEASKFVSKFSTDLPSAIRALIKTLRFRGRRPLKGDWYISDLSIRKIDSEVLRGFRTRNKGGWEGTTQFYANPNQQVVLFQDTTKKVPRVKDRLKLFYDSTLGLRDNRYSIVIVRGVPGSMAVKRALVRLGRPDIVAEIADLPLPPKQVKAPRKTVRLKHFICSNYVAPWGEVETAINAGGLYVPLDRATPQMTVDGEPKDLTTSDVRRTLDALKALGMVPDDVVLYGIPKTLSSILKKHKGWQCLWDVARDALTIGFDTCRVDRYNTIELALEKILHTSIGRLCERWMKECKIPSGKMQYLMIHYSRIVGESRSLKEQVHYRELAALFPAQYVAPDLPEKLPDDLNIRDLIDEVRERYPLMQDIVDSGFNDEASQRLLDYVLLIDSVVKADDVVVATEEAA